jgi:hypothetical protein
VLGARLEEEALGVQVGGLESCDEVGEEGDCTVSATVKSVILSMSGSRLILSSSSALAQRSRASPVGGGCLYEK